MDAVEVMQSEIRDAVARLRNRMLGLRDQVDRVSDSTIITHVFNPHAGDRGWDATHDVDETLRLRGGDFIIGGAAHNGRQ